MRAVWAQLLFLTAALQAQDAASLYRQGLDLQHKGDLKGAAEAYKKSLAFDPANIAARSNYGVVLAGSGNYDEAISEYQEAIKTAPEQFRPYLQRNLALALYKSGRLKEAAPLLITLRDRDMALLAADCLLQLGEPERALALLEPMAQTAATDKALAYVLGMAYLKTGKTTEAQRVLDPILKDESSAEGRYALGMAMFTSGDYPAAVKAFARGLELNGALPHLQSFYGRALLITGDPDAALNAFNKQLASDPNDYEANFESAQILERRGRHADADQLLRRAVMLRPDSAAAHMALAQTLLAESKQTEARTELENTVRQWPELGVVHARLAEFYTKAGLSSNALRERTLATKYAQKPDAAAHTGLKSGVLAPKFRLAKPEGSGSIDITSPERGKPTVLVFGSYSCPNFRRASPVLNELSHTLAGKVSFLQIYIREAHPTGEWQSTINERENVQMAAASTVEQKRGYAVMCQRKLHLNFPAVVDGLNNDAEKAYAAWPSRVYVLSIDGHIKYSSGLIEEEFNRKALESAIRRAQRR